MSTRDVLVATCFTCPFGRVEKASARQGTFFDCAASKMVERRPLTLWVRQYTDPPPEQCPLRHKDGVTLRAKVS